MFLTVDSSPVGCEKDSKIANIWHVASTLGKNGYSKKRISLVTNRSLIEHVLIPYIDGVSNLIKKILEKEIIETRFGTVPKYTNCCQHVVRATSDSTSRRSSSKSHYSLMGHRDRIGIDNEIYIKICNTMEGSHHLIIRMNLKNIKIPAKISTSKYPQRLLREA